MLTQYLLDKISSERKAESVCFHPLIALPFVKCFVGNINIGLTEQICLQKMNFMTVNLSQTDEYMLALKQSQLVSTHLITTVKTMFPDQQSYSHKLNETVALKSLLSGTGQV